MKKGTKYANECKLLAPGFNWQRRKAPSKKLFIFTTTTMFVTACKPCKSISLIETCLCFLSSTSIKLAVKLLALLPYLPCRLSFYPV